MLCVGHYQSEAEAIEQLKRFKSHYNSRAEWEARTTVIREGILKGAELWPLPKKTPLNPVYRNKREYDGYTVENVAIGVCVDALPVALAIAAVLPNVPTPVVVLEPPRL